MYECRVRWHVILHELSWAFSANTTSRFRSRQQKKQITCTGMATAVNTSCLNWYHFSFFGQQRKSQRTHQGTSYGFSIVNRIIKLSGHETLDTFGTLYVEHGISWSVDILGSNILPLWLIYDVIITQWHFKLPPLVNICCKYSDRVTIYLLPNTVAFGPPAILKSARKSPTISFLRPFYKMAEKNWRGMSFILWPLSATNIYQRVLGFVLLRCLACEGTWLSLFPWGTAGSISHLDTYSVFRAVQMQLHKNCTSHSKLKESGNMEQDLS